MVSVYQISAFFLRNNSFNVNKKTEKGEMCLKALLQHENKKWSNQECWDAAYLHCVSDNEMAVIEDH